ncbi:MAG: hypothetical protein SX243_22165 [Acidobacteriota bacterium]|nr:hypothetical protein [Acidobacteriota bacterium]
MNRARLAGQGVDGLRSHNYIAVLFLAALGLALIGAPKASPEAPEQRVLASAQEPVTEISWFVNEEQIRLIMESVGLEEQQQLLLEFPDFLIDKVLRDVESAPVFKDFHIEQDKLTPEGCYQYWPLHIERKYAKEEGLSTVEDLFSNAEVALIARILKSESGLSSGDFGTRFDFEVAEVLKDSGGTIKNKDLLYSSLTTFDLYLGEKRYCRLRNGFDQPEQGELFLLLGYRPDRPTLFFRVANYFPVFGGKIGLQQYSWLDQGSETRIEVLRELAIEAANGVGGV